MASKVTVEQLLETGAHFGHLTRRWNPKMRNFIFTQRNGIHIIDLRKTHALLEIARDAALEIASQGKIIMYVGTKPQAQEPIAEAAKAAGTNYVTTRWLGGMLTNFPTIRKSIKRLTSIDKMELDGTFDKITKKERLLLNRERDRLRDIFGGIEDMTRIPGALFIVDIKKEHLAIKEAKTLGIPVIGIVDTNSDPEEVDFPIPANDDSVKTIELIAKVIGDAIAEGREIAKTRSAEIGSQDSEQNDEQSNDDKPRRRMRERRGGNSGGGGGRRNDSDAQTAEAGSSESTTETTA